MNHNWAVLASLKYMSEVVARLEKKIDDMQDQIEAMQQEWRHEFEVDWGEEESDEEESDEDESDEEESDAASVQSAPASFSLEKRQRTE